MRPELLVQSSVLEETGDEEREESRGEERGQHGVLFPLRSEAEDKEIGAGQRGVRELRREHIERGSARRVYLLLRLALLEVSSRDLVQHL